MIEPMYNFLKNIKLASCYLNCITSIIRRKKYLFLFLQSYQTLNSLQLKLVVYGLKTQIYLLDSSIDSHKFVSLKKLFFSWYRIVLAQTLLIAYQHKINFLRRHRKVLKRRDQQ